MSSIEEIPIGILVHELAPTFRSVEGRLVVTKIDGVWTLVAGVLSAQYASLEAVRERHQRILREQGPLETENFELVLEALSPSVLPALLDGIDAGTLELGGKSFRLPRHPAYSTIDEHTDTHGDMTKPSESDFFPIRDQRMRGNHRVPVPDEGEIFPRYLYTLQTGRSTKNLLDAAGVRTSRLHLQTWQDLDAWIGFPYFDRNGDSPVNLELAFTVCAALASDPTTRGGSLVLRGRAQWRLPR